MFGIRKLKDEIREIDELFAKQIVRIEKLEKGIAFLHDEVAKLWLIKQNNRTPAKGKKKATTKAKGK